MILPPGSLWVCGAHGWPYISLNWTGHWIWGCPYLPVTVWQTLPWCPRNWDACYSQHTHTKWTPWWYYALGIFLPVAGDMIVETQVSTLAGHTARALNYTHRALNLVTDKVDQIRKAVLQNHMALDILTAVQGVTCAVLYTQCYIYIPDHRHNISQALAGFSQEIREAWRLIGNPLQERWASLMSTWCWVLALLGGGAYLLVACFYSLYCYCGMWIQGSALLQRSSTKLI